MQPRIPYPSRLSLKIEGEMKSFQDKQKQKKFANTKPAPQEILKGVLSLKRDPKNNRPERNRDNISYKLPKRQCNGTKFVSFNSYPECKWAKCPNQKTQGIRRDKKSICCLQDTHFKPKDTSRLKVRYEKQFTMLMDIKRKLEWQSLYQIN